VSVSLEAEIPLRERVGDRRLDGTEFRPRFSVDDGDRRVFVVAVHILGLRRLVSVTEHHPEDARREHQQADSDEDRNADHRVGAPPGLHCPDSGDGHA